MARLVPDQALTARGTSVAATAGLSFSALTATFTDADPTAASSGFQAIISWGDGTSSAGVISPASGGFAVSGSHTYMSIGSFAVSATITDTDTSHDAGGLSATAAGTASVALSALPDFTRSQHQRYVAHIYLDLLGRAVDPIGLTYWTQLLDQGMNPSKLVRWMEGTPEYRGRQVQVVCQRILNRAPDPAAIASAVAALRRGTSILNVEASLLASAEYAAGHAAATSSGFVTAVYHDVLGRAIDPVGLLWVPQLDSGLSREEFALKLLNSDEARSNRILGLYDRYLHRPADDRGLASWLPSLDRGMSDDRITAGFVGSGEYFNNV